jgi:hypothetical protein
LRAGARVLDVRDVRDVLAALPLDFLAATPSAVTAMPTPSGPQRRDAAGQCPRADSSALCLCQPGCQPAFARTVHRLLLRYSCDVIPATESAPCWGGRHHPLRVIPKTGSAQSSLPRLLIAASGMTSLPHPDGLRAGAVPRLAESLLSGRMLRASGRSIAGGSSPCCGRCKGQRLSVRSWWSAAVSGSVARRRSAAR